MSLAHPSFSIALIAMAALWLVPYIYVLIWGHDLPDWFAFLIAALVAAGLVGLFRRIRTHAQRGE